MHLTDTTEQKLKRMLLSICMAVSVLALVVSSSVFAETAPGSTVRKKEKEPATRKTVSKIVEKKTVPARQSAVKAIERKPVEKASAKAEGNSVVNHSSAVASIEKQKQTPRKATVSRTQSKDSKPVTKQASAKSSQHKSSAGTSRLAKHTASPAPEYQESGGKSDSRNSNPPNYSSKQTTNPSSSLPEFQASGPSNVQKPIVEKQVAKEHAVQKGDIRTKPRDPRQYSERTKNATKHNSQPSQMDELAKQDYHKRYGNYDTPRVYTKGNTGIREKKPAATITTVEARSATIETTIFAAAQRAGLPEEITKKFTNLFSIDVDMDVSDLKGSRFNVIYEVYRKDGRFVKSGNLLAAEFIHEGVHYQTIWYEKYTGQGEYYDVEGRSLRASSTQLSSPLRTPLDKFRISSGFGYRTHPITGGIKHHKGLDMAASTGTPVHAAADGTVREAGWHGGYGNFVLIQHTSVYATAYGHMNRIHPNVTPGLHVHQGDVIGYVGSTGISTGPHLHYEIRVNGIQQDPAKIAGISGITSMQNVTLTGNDKTRFRQHLYRMQSYFSELNANPSKRISS